jgi:hypothetical protein
MAHRQVEPWSSPRGSNSRGTEPRRAAAWQSPAGLVLEPVRPDTAGDTSQGLTSRPIASESNKEPWDFNENEQYFGEKRNPLKPHASP